jgi:hypothetical protein
MTEIEKKIIDGKKISNDFLAPKLTTVNDVIDELFQELTKNLKKRLEDLPTTDEGHAKISKIIDMLKKEIDNIKEADKELTRIFKLFIAKTDLGIDEQLKNIYDELFFMQVKLINDTIYKFVKDKDSKKYVNLNPLLKALHEKIKILNTYITENSLDKKK